MLKRLFTVRNLIILAAVIALFVISNALGLKVAAPVVSIAAEPIYTIGPLVVTNSMFTAWLVMLFLVVVALLVRSRIPRDLSKASNEDLVPSGLLNFMEIVIEYFYRMVKEISGSWSGIFFPIVMTIFLFVIISNWSELIPGYGTIGIVSPGAALANPEAGAPGHGPALIPLFRSPSADLNFTLALAIIVQVLVQYFGFRESKTVYLKHFFDTSGFRSGVLVGVAQFAAGILELISEFTKVLSFSFRLFGNIFAGEVLLVVVAFLVPYIVSVPFYGLEVFVGFIQAAVFMLLAVVFMTAAVSVHGPGEHTGA